MVMTKWVSNISSNTSHLNTLSILHTSRTGANTRTKKSVRQRLGEKRQDYIEREDLGTLAAEQGEEEIAHVAPPTGPLGWLVPTGGPKKMY